MVGFNIFCWEKKVLNKFFCMINNYKLWYKNEIRIISEIILLSCYLIFWVKRICKILKIMLEYNEYKLI